MRMSDPEAAGGHCMPNEIPESIVGEDWRPKWPSAGAVQNSFGEVGGPNGHQPQPFQIPWAALAA